jgi:hypothetical protein
LHTHPFSMFFVTADPSPPPFWNLEHAIGQYRMRGI